MEKGLTEAEAKQKLTEFGSNEISSEEKTNYLILFFSQFPNLINVVLAIASALSFIIGGTIDGSLILVILFLNAVFGFVQEYRAEKALDKFKFLLPNSFLKILPLFPKATEFLQMVNY